MIEMKSEEELHFFLESLASFPPEVGQGYLKVRWRPSITSAKVDP